MQVEGRIQDGDTSQMRVWQPDQLLSTLSALDARYSRGFSRFAPQMFLNKLSQHWLPLWHSVGSAFDEPETFTSLDFPDGLAHVVPIEVDGEPAVLGLSESSAQLLMHAIAPGCSSASGQILLDYLQRRLLSTLTSSWTGSRPLRFSYVPVERMDAVEVIGSVHMRCRLNGGNFQLSVGCGQQLVDRLDELWRGIIIEQNLIDLPEAHEQDLALVSIELAELAVPPALLIDYMRSGTVINLGIPMNPNVTVRVNGEAWAVGLLRQFNGRFAVEICEWNTKANRHTSSTTRVQIQLARMELEEQSLKEYAQQGAILLTKTPVASSASMVISGEDVSSALIGEINGQYVLNVLPK